MTADVEEELEVKSLSVVRVHITPGLLYAARGYWTQCKPGKGERRGGQLASERSQWEGQAAYYGHKNERDTGRGISITQMMAMSIQELQVLQRKVTFFWFGLENCNYRES